MPTEDRPPDAACGPGSLAHWILGSHHEIVLASRSPRRRAILAALGVPVRVMAVDVDEAFHAGEPRAAGAQRVAALKVAAARREGARGLVLGADTVVVVEESVLGKPKDDGDARRMLGLLAGRAHRVVTGIALGYAASDGFAGAVLTDAESTEVVFRDLARAEIEDYVATGEPRDKAGAYGIQGLGAMLVREVRGDYWNIVGLPLYRLQALARRLPRGRE